MAFNPFKPTQLSLRQAQLINTIDQDLATWQSDAPHFARRFLTKLELLLLKHLLLAHPSKIVAPQVQLIRLVNLDVKSIREEWQRSGSHPYRFPDIKKLIEQINKLSIDFVICNLYGIPKLAIELDGAEHSYDPRVIEQWVVDSSKNPNWDGSTLLEAPKKVQAWYRDRIKNHAIESAGINIIRVDNSDVDDPDRLSDLDAQINRYVV